MAEAAPSSLDLFQKTDTQTAIVDGSWMEIRPLNSIEERAPWTFTLMAPQKISLTWQIHI